MIGIVCLDQNNGMYFNKRRQSRDWAVIRDLVFMTKDATLYMNPYSEELFKEYRCEYVISCDDFCNALENDYCFIENQGLNLTKMSKLIVYRWDKVYPADYRLDLSGWVLKSTMEFSGNSHESIIKEVYEKDE